MASQINASNSGFGGIVSTGDSSGVLQLQTTGTTALTIDTSQNVGIGTTSPVGKLDIGSGNLNFSSTAQRITGDFSNATVANRVIFQSSTTNGNSAITAMPNGTATTSSFQAFNTNDPANTSATQVLALSTESSFRNAINGTGTYLPMTFYTGGSERMRIDSSGNVGINSTSNTNWKLLVSGGGSYALSSGANGYFCVRGNNQTLPSSDNGTADTPNLAIGVNYSNGSAEVDYFNCNNAGDGHYWYQKTGAAAATNIMKISSGGNLTISGATATKASGTTWANPSDIRLKDNVQDFAKGLTELLQVNVKTWEYNGKGGTVEGTKGIGVIADEIEKVLPETVDTYKAKLNETDTEETDIKRFDATEITWLLVKAIQEQQTIINDLKARIETLESK